MKNFPKSMLMGEGVACHLDDTKALLTWQELQDPKDRGAMLKEAGLVLVSEAEGGQLLNQHTRACWVQKPSGAAFTAKDWDAMQERLSSHLRFAAPVYKDSTGNGRFSAFPHALLVNRKALPEKELLAKLEKAGLKVNKERSQHLSAHYYVEVGDHKRENAFQAMEKLGLEAGMAFTENMPMVAPYALTDPNDAMWAQQWNMRRVNADKAWDLSTGDATVRIAIIDTGCDLGHPDLRFAQPGINVGVPGAVGGPNGWAREWHGTACAGIAAASFNNTTGVSGMAGNSTIIPIALQNATDAEMAAAINFAATNGARIISMSLAAYLPGEGQVVIGWNLGIINPEIDFAFNTGAVICASAGNANADLLGYPARHNRVMAIGATSTNDNRKKPSSPDGNASWGSNYGRMTFNGVRVGISVMAPGVQSPTTDIQGAGGSNTTGNFMPAFGGTSCSCPTVAGAAAIMLALNPRLSNREVRRIIETTASKTGASLYTSNQSFPNGTSNKYMGYGLLNAELAARDATPVHIVAVNNQRRLLHTVRYGTTVWQQFLGDVEGPVGETGDFMDTDCALSSQGLHVLAVTTDGRILHALRFPNGNWQSGWTNLEAVIGEVGQFFRVSCTTASNVLHVAAITNTGKLLHVTRDLNGVWQQFWGDVSMISPGAGDLRDVACAAVNGEVHVLGINQINRLVHTIRYANGTWQQQFGDVNWTNNITILFNRVSACAVRGRLHVVTVRTNGDLWKLSRHANGNWFDFVAVENAVGQIAAVSDVGAGQTSLQMHVVTNPGGNLLHTHAEVGSPTNSNQLTWQRFWGDVEGQTGDSGSYTAIGVS